MIVAKLYSMLDKKMLFKLILMRFHPICEWKYFVYEWKFHYSSYLWEIIDAIYVHLELCTIYVAPLGRIKIKSVKITKIPFGKFANI